MDMMLEVVTGSAAGPAVWGNTQGCKENSGNGAGEWGWLGNPTGPAAWRKTHRAARTIVVFVDCWHFQSS